MAANYQAIGPKFESITDGTAIWPTHLTGDVGFLCCETAVEAVSTPSGGWAEVSNSPQQASTLTRLTVFWKAAASAGESNVTITDPGNHVGGFIITFRGCDTSTPVDLTAGGVKSATDADISIPGVNATQNGNDVLYLMASDRIDGTVGSVFENVTGTNANLTGVGQRTLFGTHFWTSGNDGCIGAWTGNLASAGATGTLTGTAPITFRGAFLCIALLAPAAGGQPAVKRMGGVKFAHGGYQQGTGRMQWRHDQPRDLWLPNNKIIHPEFKLVT